MKRTQSTQESRGTGLPFRGICVARRGQAWHGAATGTGSDPQSTDFNGFSFAASDNKPKWQFWQQNQRLALIAALLRGVWYKSEAPGPKLAFQGTRKAIHLTGFPACGTRRCGGVSS